MHLKKIKILSWLSIGKKPKNILKQEKVKLKKQNMLIMWNDESTYSATSEMKTQVLVLDSKELKDICYMMPCPKSPHGCDVDPTGEYIVGSGKLAALIPVFSFDKLQNAIKNKQFEGEYEGIPVIKYKLLFTEKFKNQV
jgi:nitrous-oxide reductase